MKHTASGMRHLLHYGLDRDLVLIILRVSGLIGNGMDVAELITSQSVWKSEQKHEQLEVALYSSVML